MLITGSELNRFIKNWPYGLVWESVPGNHRNQHDDVKLAIHQKRTLGSDTVYDLTSFGVLYAKQESAVGRVYWSFAEYYSYWLEHNPSRLGLLFD